MLSFPSVIAVLASLLVLYPGSGSGSAQFLDQNCGKTRNGHSPQTLGPWTALLHSNGRIVCAGTLIHPKFILTAANCIKNGETLKVRLGEYGRVGAEKPEEHSVRLDFRHRRYNNATLENNIALMMLTRSVQYKAHIKPICIVLDPSSNWLKLVESNFKVLTGAAWDQKNKSRYRSGDFHATNITRLPQNECPANLKVQDKFQFCGWNPKAPSSCEGPSGSALSQVITNEFVYQIGIASFNDVDCEHTRIYTDVPRYSEWILKTVYLYGGSVDQRRHKPVVFPTDSSKTVVVPTGSSMRSRRTLTNSANKKSVFWGKKGRNSRF
ncbi:kallikrein-13 [Drosophila kikkawai]|uniref:Kallikrein-13 n=1 Tax=Drosophila kikkawai TaxID=30033 RepID=A0ABM4GBY9_DROKI